MSEFQQSISNFYSSNHMYDDPVCHCNTQFNSDTLIITIGESWTWGAKLDPNKRIDQIWGKLVAQSKKMDWLNIARPGTSNTWMFYQVQDLCRYIANGGNFPYKKIQFIFLCTELGREFREQWEWNTFDPTKMFPCAPKPVDDLFRTLNSMNINYLCQQLNLLQDLQKHLIINVALLHNFCGHQTWTHNFATLGKNWIQVTGDNEGVTLDTNIATFSPHVFKKYAVDLDTIIEYQDRSLQLIDYLESSKYYTSKAENYNTNHPKPDCHRLWADYVVKNLEIK